MLTDEQLVLAVRRLAKSGRKAPAVLILSQLEQPAQTGDIRDKATAVGFREIKQWNLSDVLKSAADDDLVAQVKGSWKVLDPGYELISDHYVREAPIIAETRHALKTHLAKVTNEQRRAFLDEALCCFDVKAYRAAIVLSWVGAVHILQEYIVTRHKNDFNKAGIERQKRLEAKGEVFPFAPVKSLKDFGTLPESDLLQICQDAGIIHKAEKKLLQDRLDLRNQCGHPNPLTFAEHATAFHLEQLMLNVYSRY